MSWHNRIRTYISRINSPVAYQLADMPLIKPHRVRDSRETCFAFAGCTTRSGNHVCCTWRTCHADRRPHCASSRYPRQTYPGDSRGTKPGTWRSPPRDAQRTTTRSRELPCRLDLYDPAPGQQRSHIGRTIYLERTLRVASRSSRAGTADVLQCL